MYIFSYLRVKSSEANITAAGAVDRGFVYVYRASQSPELLQTLPKLLSRASREWFSYNLELVTEATDATVAPEVVASSAAQCLPSTRAGGQDDVS